MSEIEDEFKSVLHKKIKRAGIKGEFDFTILFKKGRLCHVDEEINIYGDDNYVGFIGSCMYDYRKDRYICENAELIVKKLDKSLPQIAKAYKDKEERKQKYIEKIRRMGD